MRTKNLSANVVDREHTLCMCAHPVIDCFNCLVVPVTDNDNACYLCFSYFGFDLAELDELDKFS